MGGRSGAAAKRHSLPAAGQRAAKGAARGGVDKRSPSEAPSSQSKQSGRSASPPAAGVRKSKRRKFDQTVIESVRSGGVGRDDSTAKRGRYSSDKNTPTPVAAAAPKQRGSGGPGTRANSRTTTRTSPAAKSTQPDDAKVSTTPGYRRVPVPPEIAKAKALAAANVSSGAKSNNVDDGPPALRPMIECDQCDSVFGQSYQLSRHKGRVHKHTPATRSTPAPSAASVKPEPTLEPEEEEKEMPKIMDPIQTSPEDPPAPTPDEGDMLFVCRHCSVRCSSAARLTRHKRVHMTGLKAQRVDSQSEQKNDPDASPPTGGVHKAPPRPGVVSKQPGTLDENIFTVIDGITFKGIKLTYNERRQVERTLKRAYAKREKEAITETGASPRSTAMLLCDLCGAGNAFKETFIRHLIGHARQEKYKCTDCTWSSSLKNSVTRHYDAVHSPAAEATKTVDSKCGARGAQVTRQEPKPLLPEAQNDSPPEQAPKMSPIPTPSKSDTSGVKTASHAKMKSSTNSEVKTSAASAQSTDKSKRPYRKRNRTGTKWKGLRCTDPKCPFITESSVKLAAHMEGHRRTTGWACPHCTYRTMSTGFFGFHVKMHLAAEQRNKATDVDNKSALPNGSACAPLTIKTSESVHPTPVSKATITLAGGPPVAPLLIKEGMKVFHRRSFFRRRQFRCGKCHVHVVSAAAVLSHRARSRHCQKFAMVRTYRFTLDNRPALACVGTQAVQRAAETDNVIQTPPTLPPQSNANAEPQGTRPMAVSSHTKAHAPGSVRMYSKHVCELCPFKTGSISNFMAHKRCHAAGAGGITKHRCSKCSFGCNVRFTLGRHEMLHEARENTHAPAGQKLHSQKLPMAELQSIKQAALNRSPRSDRPRRFKCPHCPYMGRFGWDLRQHEQYHRGAGKLHCRFCNYSCSLRHSMERHEKMHVAAAAGFAYGAAPEAAGQPGANAPAPRPKPTGASSSTPCVVPSDVFNKLAEVAARPLLNSVLAEAEGIVVRAVSAEGNGVPVAFSITVPDQATMIYKCIQCPYVTELTSKASEHWSGHANSPNSFLYKCARCTFSAPHLAKLQTHDVVHSINYDDRLPPAARPLIADAKLRILDASLARDACAMGSNAGSRMVSTVRYACPSCKLITVSQAAFFLHRQSKHSAEKPEDRNVEFSCRLCDFKARNLSRTWQHFLSAHYEPWRASTGNAAPTLQAGEPPKPPSPVQISPPAATQRHDPVKELISAMKEKKAIVMVEDRFDEAVSGGISGQSSSTPAVCSYCPFKAPSRDQLPLHEALHSTHPNRPFRCPECGFCVSSGDTLMEHLSLHGLSTTKQQISRTRTGFIRGSRRDLFDMNAKRLSCPYCLYTTAFGDKFVEHQKDHVREFQRGRKLAARVNLGEAVGNNGARQRNLHGHARAYVTGAAVFVPDVDADERANGAAASVSGSETLSRKGSQSQLRGPRHPHILSCSGTPGAFQCDDCSFRCDTAEAFARHRTMHASGPTAAVDGFQFMCCVCDYMAKTESVVRFHEQHHHVDVPFSILLDKMHRRSANKQEKDQDEKTRNVLCNGAPETATMDGELRCTMCDYSAGSLDQIQVHWRRAHLLHQLKVAMKPQ